MPKYEKPSDDMSEDPLRWSSMKQQKAARNIESSKDVLVRLCKSQNVIARRLLAKNRACPNSALQTLSADRDPGVRVALASNSAISDLILRALARDRDANVRAAVAASKRADGEVLNGLARDDSHFVRAAVAKNPRTSLSVLVELGRDTHNTVRDAAIETLFGGERPVDTKYLEYAEKFLEKDESHQRSSGASEKNSDISGDVGPLNTSATGRLPSSPACPRTIFTEIRTRGEPSIVVRFSAVPRIQRSNTSLDFDRLLSEIGWMNAVIHTEKSEIQKFSGEFLRKSIFSIGGGIGISDEELAGFVTDCLYYRYVLVEQSPPEQWALSGIIALATKFVERPWKPCVAILAVGGALVVVRVLYFSSEPIGIALGKRIAGGIYSEQSVEDPVPAIERYLEQEALAIAQARKTSSF